MLSRQYQQMSTTPPKFSPLSFLSFLLFPLYYIPFLPLLFFFLSLSLYISLTAIAIMQDAKMNSFWYLTLGSYQIQEDKGQLD